MASTDRQIATFDADGRFALPSALAQELGIATGSRYEITLEQQEIRLKPMPAETKNSRDLQPTQRRKFDETAINELRAMLAGGPSLEDELLASRREEHASRLQREKEWL
jgi:bifunctional DNA-binding transcriptional regulator/antitoxin component of YhaV-PrlF toxin-antitoxin module